jgi:hypothetical protein
VEELLEQALTLHAQAETAALPHLVRPSVPILFFGDSGRYERSLLKVITVGLNPSKLEFPTGNPFERFPAAGNLPAVTTNGALAAYRLALDDYFRVAPYNAWFKPSFEELLRGLGSSFYDGAESAAVHTDLCSPLATDPTWSGLGHSEQTALLREGSELWHALVERLQPDVVLISIKREHLRKIRFPILEDARPIYTVERERPYTLELSRRQLASGKDSVFVFGKAAQTPFGLISGAAKREAGAAIREVVDA